MYLSFNWKNKLIWSGEITGNWILLLDSTNEYFEDFKFCNFIFSFLLLMSAGINSGLQGSGSIIGIKFIVGVFSIVFQGIGPKFKNVEIVYEKNSVFSMVFLGSNSKYWKF